MNTDSGEKGGISLFDRLLIWFHLVMGAGVLALLLLMFVIQHPPQMPVPEASPVQAAALSSGPMYWTAADFSGVSDPQRLETLKYGKELIAHTANYLGPKGSVLKISNGLNCQNCHLDAGTRVFGNNYGSVASLYPKFRARSGTIEDLNKRINDCMERSLNGKALDTLSRELIAIREYIAFIGSNVPKGKPAEGSGLKSMPFLDRAADPKAGKIAYEAKCQLCHQANGEGQLDADGIAYVYPPMWGPNSYNDGAGLYRLSNFARYIKYNMPLGATHDSPQLTDEEAWDIAAFVNSQPRPQKDITGDWPDISKKPIDHPFGPFADEFSEKQHKYGPFEPIQEARKQRESLSSSTAASP